MALTMGSSRLKNRYARRAQQSRLDGGVALQAAVAVEMVCRDIQHRRGGGAEAAGGLQLKTGQFEYVDPGRIRQQVHGRGSQVAPGGGANAGSRQHALHQGDHGALAVGAGDRDHRSAGGAGEQLDLADQGDSAAARFGRDADIQTQSRRNDHLGYSLQPPRMEAFELDLQLRLRGAQGFEPRRVCAAVDHQHLLAACGQESRRRESRGAQTHYQCAVIRQRTNHLVIAQLRRSAHRNPSLLPRTPAT